MSKPVRETRMMNVLRMTIVVFKSITLKARMIFLGVSFVVLGFHWGSFVIIMVRYENTCS